MFERLELYRARMRREYFKSGLFSINFYNLKELVSL